MIKAVLFDYGGVLNTFGKQGSTEKVLADYFGIDVDDVNIDEIHEQLRSGLISTADFFAELNRRHTIQSPMTEKIFLESTADFLTKSTEVYELAEELRSKGIKTGILSNVYQMSADSLRQQGFYDGFDPVILSCEVKMAKPDTRIYRLAAERLKLKPEEIIFVDDQAKCWPPAEKLGMKVVKALSPKQIVNDITKIIRHENSLQF